MMQVYISGTTGFVGTNLSSYLDRAVYSLHAVDLRKEIDAGTLRDADAVVHLAGKAHDLSKATDPAAYDLVNFGLTKSLYDQFLRSGARIFIFISSVKASADTVAGELTEVQKANPQTEYGKSKLKAENYLLGTPAPPGKLVYILRPCMIHGPGNKGNLNLLYKVVSKKIPWPLGSFHNNRSFLSIDNLCFTIAELLTRIDVPPGIYNVSDSESLSTTQLISIMADELNIKTRIIHLPRKIIHLIAKMGDILHLPLNSERLKKLTENYVVSNQKLVTALNKSLPVSAEQGIRATVRSFSQKSRSGNGPVL